MEQMYLFSLHYGLVQVNQEVWERFLLRQPQNNRRSEQTLVKLPQMDPGTNLAQQVDHNKEWQI